MITLVAGDTVEALFEDWIALIPERQREAQTLMVISDSANTVFAPTVGAQM